MDQEDNDQHVSLPILSEKHLLYPIDISRTAYNDLHDLLAVINLTANEITVYRAINGQIAFTAKYPDQYEESEPLLVSWKPDGSLLGIGWEDGTCCLYSGEDGKLVSRVSTLVEAEEAEWRLDLNGSAVAEVDDEVARQHPPKGLVWTGYQRPIHGSQDSLSGKGEKAGNGLSTDDWFDVVSAEPGAGLNDTASVRKHGIQTLVDSITTLDVTTVLPGLSALPAHGLRGSPEAAKFANQVGVDNAFLPSASSSDNIDVLLACGTSHTFIYLDDSVKIGSVALDLQDAVHASHPECASQAVLSRSRNDSSCQLNFVDLPLDILGGSLLQVIASNTKRLQSLITYVTHSVRCIQHDYVSGQQLPTRILNGFTAELREKDEGDPITALFELSMTARFTPTMIEWLTDVVKDTMRKRWEQSVLDLYDHIQTHIFMRLLPACNRLSIAASTLRGQAELHEGTSTFDVPAAFLQELEDCTDALRLAAERAQLIVIAEQRQFKAFIKWLRVMIDVASAGPGSKSAVETEQRDSPNVDFGLTGTYIKQTMGSSKLAPFVEQLPEMKGGLEKSHFFNHPVVEKLKRDNTMEAIKRMNAATISDAGSTSKNVLEATPSLNLPALTARLVAQARLCLDNITAWQQKILMRQTGLDRSSTELQIESKATVLDMKIFPSVTQQDGNACTTHILLGLSQTDGCSLELRSITRSRTSVEERRHTIPLGHCTILHAQLIDRETCFVLLKLSAADSALSSYELVSYELADDDMLEIGRKRVIHSFPSSQLVFRPARFTACGRHGKKVVVVFGEDERSWQVLDLEGSTPPTMGIADKDELDEMES